MPVYLYKCQECLETLEIQHSMSEVGNKRECPCFSKANLERQYVPINIKGMSGGSILTEAQLLKKKQQQRSDRSKLHFKKEVLPTIQDPGEKRVFEKRLRHIDATKKLK